MASLASYVGSWLTHNPGEDDGGRSVVPLYDDDKEAVTMVQTPDSLQAPRRAPTLRGDELLATLQAPPSISMELARAEHAEFIYGLRVDPALNRHLSQAPDSVGAQQDFLRRYALFEAEGEQYYFVIRNKHTGVLCGTVRLYDMQPGSFCWGSWILAAGKPRLAAVESALFVYDLGFGWLRYRASHFDVRKGNAGVIAFHERLGAQQTGEDDANHYFRLSAEALAARLPPLLELTGYRMRHFGVDT